MVFQLGSLSQTDYLALPKKWKRDMRFGTRISGVYMSGSL
jgi:hypothetical protein